MQGHARREGSLATALWTIQQQVLVPLTDRGLSPQKVWIGVLDEMQRSSPAVVEPEKPLSRQRWRLDATGMVDGEFLQLSHVADSTLTEEQYFAIILRKTALLSLESFLTTTAIVLGLKAVVGRSRPYSGDAPNTFNPFSFENRRYSFPSGDAAGAFSVATTIAEQTEDIFIDVMSYGLAGLVAFYRVHDRKHWPSDVFFGSAIGHFVAKQVCRLDRDREARDFRVAFRWTRDVRAVTLTLAF